MQTKRRLVLETELPSQSIWSWDINKNMFAQTQIKNIRPKRKGETHVMEMVCTKVYHLNSSYHQGKCFNNVLHNISICRVSVLLAKKYKNISWKFPKKYVNE
jgi:hypothetical protein